MLGIERATFVGHDTGGGVALILAVEHPDRVARLVLTNAVAYDSWPVDDMIALGNPRWQDKSSSEVAAFVAGGLPDGIAHTERLTPEFLEGIVAPWTDDEGAVSLIRNASALNTNHTMELVDRLSSISASTLVLWGVRDPWQPLSDGHRLAREIPGARRRLALDPARRAGAVCGGDPRLPVRHLPAEGRCVRPETRAGRLRQLQP